MTKKEMFDIIDKICEYFENHKYLSVNKFEDILIGVFKEK